jgi:hypothetical protein
MKQIDAGRSAFDALMPTVASEERRRQEDALPYLAGDYQPGKDLMNSAKSAISNGKNVYARTLFSKAAEFYAGLAARAEMQEDKVFAERLRSEAVTAYRNLEGQMDTR